MSKDKLLNSLPQDKSLALTKVKALADDKCNIAKMVISVFDILENMVKKGENAGFQHFSPFPTMFSNCYFLGVFKSRFRRIFASHLCRGM